MSAYGRWRATLEGRQDARILERARADQAVEAFRAQQRNLDLARLRRVPAGLELHLQPGDWLDSPELRTRDRVDLKVSTLIEPIMYQIETAWVRVWGHTPTCGQRLADYHAPCITAHVRLTVILDAALIA